MKIYKKLTKQQIDGLRMFVQGICQQCEKKEKEMGKLEPHRLNQDRDYTLSNIKMCCKKCHEIFSSAQRIASNTQSSFLI